MCISRSHSSGEWLLLAIGLFEQARPNVGNYLLLTITRIAQPVRTTAYTAFSPPIIDTYGYNRSSLGARVSATKHMVTVIFNSVWFYHWLLVWIILNGIMNGSCDFLGKFLVSFFLFFFHFLLMDLYAPFHCPLLVEPKCSLMIDCLVI
jgi:hypothetical protein